jgi:predicted O-methyltransferase YrrM
VDRRAGLLIAAVRSTVRSPRRVLRAAARAPLEVEASERIEALPRFELADLLDGASDISVRLAPGDTRHSWSLGAAEQFVLQALIQSRGCKTAFEIGTFNGGTTRLLAETLPEDGRVWTLDLPPVDFDESQGPEGFAGADVGAAYRSSAAVGKITQLLGDSTRFDFGPYEGTIDLVLVDGGHEYENGASDTRAALRLVRQGGVIVWDDFEQYWHGLVNGICDAMGDRPFGRLAGTSLAVYVDEGATNPDMR